MGIGTILLIIAGSVAIIFSPLFAFEGACAADQRGRNRTFWLLLCGLFFPILILLFLLPRRKRLEFISERDDVHLGFLHGSPS